VLELHRLERQQVGPAVESGGDLHLFDELVLGQIELHDRADRLEIVGVW